jgi:hypothetical protein
MNDAPRAGAFFSSSPLNTFADRTCFVGTGCPPYGVSTFDAVIGAGDKIMRVPAGTNYHRVDRLQNRARSGDAQP